MKTSHSNTIYAVLILIRKPEAKRRNKLSVWQPWSSVILRFVQHQPSPLKCFSGCQSIHFEVPSWLRKNAFCLSQSAFSNFSPYLINLENNPKKISALIGSKYRKSCFHSISCSSKLPLVNRTCAHLWKLLKLFFAVSSRLFEDSHSSLI